jgi:DNA repair exonuclease SbcCD ATPase subunit
MLSAHQRDWSSLQSLCGPDKIQALEIDAAAPIVTQTANDLLRSCFGDQFSIRFQTVKDGKEVFDILVYDQTVGEEKNLKDISGGEEVWILKALRLALVLLTKEKSGRVYLTLYGDEEDGKLALENRLAYLEMYRRMLNLGNFQTCFLVSHTPELIEACDHKMYFRRGAIDIR